MWLNIVQRIHVPAHMPGTKGFVWLKDFTVEKKTFFLRKCFHLFGNKKKCQEKLNVENFQGKCYSNRGNMVSLHFDKEKEKLKEIVSVINYIFKEYYLKKKN